MYNSLNNFSRMILVMFLTIFIVGNFYFITKTYFNNVFSESEGISLTAGYGYNQPVYIKNSKGIEKKILVKISSTEKEKKLGLSGTEYLDDYNGMLFVFKKADIQKFWMKDMNYDLDIIWIDASKKVTGISKNAKSDSYNYTDPSSSEIYSSGRPAKYVLEVNSGTSDRLGITEGSTISW